jgi:hypothetical protein
LESRKEEKNRKEENKVDTRGPVTEARIIHEVVGRAVTGRLLGLFGLF